MPKLRAGICVAIVFTLLACRAERTTEPFAVHVTLSPVAREQLGARHESIIVGASFFGLPVGPARFLANDMGEIGLGSDRIELWQAGDAVFRGSRYDHRKVILLKDRDVKLLINVYSGRHSDPNNLLECSIFEDSLAKAQRNGVAISCKLIAETSGMPN